MANNRIQIKRTSVSGRAANTTTLTNAGELALNMTDGIMYSTNGSVVFEIGANTTNSRVTNNLTVGGTVTATGIVSGSELTSTNASGDEGGQINLTKPPNATTAGGVTIDAYQNRVRIFEQGGNARGAYIDLTACANGVGTNLLAPSSGSINTSAQFTWTNTHTFQANVNFTGNNITVVSNTGSVMFGGAGDTNWRIGRSTGSFNKSFYTNNTLDFIAANSNLEGIAFGFTGNSVYLETGYAGTFTINPIYIGNSSVNVSINSTSFSGTSNNSTNLGGTAAASYVQNTDSRTLSGNLIFSGANVVYNTGLKVGANVIANTSTLFVGNSTVNTNIAAGSISVNGAVIANNSGIYATGTVNAVSYTIGTNWTANTTRMIYGSTTSLTGLGTSDTLVVSGVGANATLGFARTDVPLSTQSVGGIDFYANSGSTLALGGTINFRANENWSGTALGTDIQFRAVATGTTTLSEVARITSSGAVNAASHTIGTTFVANTSAVYFGTINSTSNGVVVNATSFVIGNSSVNATINSTSFTGSANNATNAFGKAESALNVNSALTANNSTNLGGTAAASYVQNSDSRTLSGNLNFTGANLTITGNLTIASTGELIITSGAGIYANGSLGTANQVLTTNGTTVYWANSSGGGGFTNGQSISVNNFVLTGGFSANSSNGAAGQVLSSNGSSAYWSSMSVVDVYYANGTLAFQGSGSVPSLGSLSANSQLYTGNGSNTVYTLATAVTDQDNILVMLDGLVQAPNTDYTASGSTLTFTSAPTNNTAIEVRYLTSTVSAGKAIAMAMIFGG